MKKLREETREFTKVKKLALVWGDDGDSPLVIIPLKDVTEEKYNHFTQMLGVPKGRTEEFINLMGVR
jgi:hypothetical protein